MVSTGYPEERLHFVQGLVEETIPAQTPDQIALCRLDTDYYESTKHEMEHLYERITSGGIMLLGRLRRIPRLPQSRRRLLRRTATTSRSSTGCDASARLLFKP